MRVRKIAWAYFPIMGYDHQSLLREASVQVPMRVDFNNANGALISFAKVDTTSLLKRATLTAKKIFELI